MMLRSLRKRPEHLEALDRVKEWTRGRFKLPADAAILVSQIACGLPGCPPLETVIAFWTANDTRHQFKVFKPVAEVVPASPASLPDWMGSMKDSIEILGDVVAPADEDTDWEALRN